MDLSSLPEDQKQQLQQLQHQFQQHQQQQQQEAAQQQQQQQLQQRQQQQQEHYYYDQSSYDQHQSYYSHFQQQNPQPYRQHYDYYTNAYRQPSETAPLPAVESGGTAGLGQGQQDQVYYPQHVGSGGDQSNLRFPAAAAAASALSQLTQYGHIVGHGAPGSFVGPGPALYGGRPVGRLANRFGGRRGGRGGQGNFGNRGRGHGRGRGMPSLYSPQGASSSFAHPEEVAQPLAENSDKPAQAEMPKGDAGPTQQHVRVAWCELCMVDCTSMEILEQHKNGKKHRKNMQKLEASKIVHQIPVINIQSASDSNPAGKLQPENVNEGEDNNNGTEQNHDLVGQAQNTEEEQSYNQRRGLKRKMRGNRGGKRMKTSDAPRQAIKPPKQPKVVIPLICDLCNVKCDTQEVFDRHLSGKKHISKLKRFESHQALYGPTGLQALYPPNPISQTLYQSKGPQQTFSGPLGLHPTPTAHIGPQVHAAAAGVVDSGFQQNPDQVLDGRSEPGTQQASAAVSLS